MVRDLFQIAQMHDIYFTLHMWALLSPQLVNENSRERKTLTNHNGVKRKQRKMNPDKAEKDEILFSNMPD